MDTYIDKCGLTKWIGAYSHFAYLLPLSAILPTHAKCDQMVEITICASFWGDCVSVSYMEVHCVTPCKLTVGIYLTGIQQPIIFNTTVCAS